MQLEYCSDPHFRISVFAFHVMSPVSPSIAYMLSSNSCLPQPTPPHRHHEAPPTLPTLPDSCFLRRQHRHPAITHLLAKLSPTTTLNPQPYAFPHHATMPLPLHQPVLRPHRHLRSLLHRGPPTLPAHSTRLPPRHRPLHQHQYLDAARLRRARRRSGSSLSHIERGRELGYQGGCEGQWRRY